MEQKMLDELRKPFNPSDVVWKPGAVKGDRALAMPYADLRAYMNRLDEVCGDEWSVSYEPWGNDRIICRLTIGGVTRSSTGETTNESEKSEIGGTVAEAQAFKRASAMFGLGRYLYNLPSGWMDYDASKRQFTAQAKAKLMGILTQHYRRATEGKTEVAEIFTKKDSQEDGDSEDAEPSPLLKQFHALGEELYGEQWQQVCIRNVQRISGGQTMLSNKLTSEQIQQLIKGMALLKSKRVGPKLGEASESPPHQRLWGQGMSVIGPDWDMARPWLISKWTALVTPNNTRNSASELSDDEKDMLADYLKENASKLQEIWPNQKAIILQRSTDAKPA